MPIDYYPQKSIAELKGLLENLQRRQTHGGITEVLAAGVRTTRDFRNSGNSRVEVEIRRVMYSLHRRAKGTAEAENYPDPYAEMVRHTRARYTFS